MDDETQALVTAAVKATSTHLMRRWQRIIALLPNKIEDKESDKNRLDLCMAYADAVNAIEDQACETIGDIRTAGGMMLLRIKEIEELPTSTSRLGAMHRAILKHCAEECLSLASDLEREAKHTQFQGFERPENHTEECFVRYQREVELVRQSARDALSYLARWPGVCRVCNGAGGFNHYDYDTGYDYEPCSCSEAGRCPRCGDVFLQEGDREEQCPSCGWNTQDPDILPDYDGGPGCYGECKGEPIFW